MKYTCYEFKNRKYVKMAEAPVSDYVRPNGKRVYLGVWTD